MKAMKYILIVIALISMLTVQANVWSQQPNACMHSTSTMLGSGSSLPQAAISGTYTTYDSYESGSLSRGPKKAAAKEDEDEEDTPPADPNGPNEPPLGDALLPLLLLAAGYVVLVARKRRASSLKQ